MFTHGWLLSMNYFNKLIVHAYLIAKDRRELNLLTQINLLTQFISRHICPNWTASEWEWELHAMNTVL